MLKRKTVKRNETRNIEVITALRLLKEEEFAMFFVGFGEHVLLFLFCSVHQGGKEERKGLWLWSWGKRIFFSFVLELFGT